MTHSKRDWIGIYRVIWPFTNHDCMLTRPQKGANKSPTVTKTSSLGMWVPVHDDEWDGDIPRGLERSDSPTRETGSGEVTFKGDTLPWVIGEYEVRH